MRRQWSKLRTRRLLILLLRVGSLWALFWSLTTALVPALAREALPSLQARLKPIGIEPGDVAISGLRISPWLNGAGIGLQRTRGQFAIVTAIFTAMFGGMGMM